MSDSSSAVKYLFVFLFALQFRLILYTMYLPLNNNTFHCAYFFKVMLMFSVFEVELTCIQLVDNWSSASFAHHPSQLTSVPFNCLCVEDDLKRFGTSVITSSSPFRFPLDDQYRSDVSRFAPNSQLTKHVVTQLHVVQLADLLLGYNSYNVTFAVTSDFMVQNFFLSL